jgi:hypothetical protein
LSLLYSKLNVSRFQADEGIADRDFIPFADEDFGNGATSLEAEIYVEERYDGPLRTDQTSLGRGRRLDVGLSRDKKNGR